MNRKNIILLLVVCLLLCACEKPSMPTVGTVSTTAPAGEVAYTVTVVDQNGEPVTGAVLQLCKEELCQPGVTDENGVFVWYTAPETYKVAFIRMPDGYGYADENAAFYFPDGSQEMKINLIKNEN